MTRPLYRPHGQPTERGWLFLGRHGGPCDKACKMCYYAFQQQLVFFSLPTLLHHANRMRHYYGLSACDISGGEATIYGPKEGGRRPRLEALVRHCANIGLAPTIITHGQNNTAELVAGVEDAGLEDWLISLHGLAEGHERTVVNHQGDGAGGWGRVIAGLAHCRRPVRFNTTLQNFNAAELPGLARWLADHRPPTVWNLIQFNPFYAWNERPDIDFQTPMAALAPLVGEAVRIAEAAGWEVNVRYFPYCVAAEHGFARNCINFYQTQVDPWEWDLLATNRVPLREVQRRGGTAAARRVECDRIAAGRRNRACAGCRFNRICEGPTTQYQARYGVDELRPIAGATVTDINYFEHGAFVSD